MISLHAIWIQLFPTHLTPVLVDQDLARHGVDPRPVRQLLDLLSEEYGAAFAAGVLAGIRFALLGARALRSDTPPANVPRGRMIPFPPTQVRSA